MNSSHLIRSCLTLAALTLALALPAGATPPGAPWITADVGKPPIPGATDVDANGVWSLTGSGRMRWGFGGEFDNTKTDQFHAAYQRVQGDASITARFLDARISGAWIVNVGLMIRADDTPRSPNVYYLTDLFGLSAQARLGPGRQNRLLGFIGPGSTKQRGLTMRLQRGGNEITGFYSQDGRLWYPDFDPVTLPDLPGEALFGLMVNSDRNTLTATWDQVQVQAGAVLVPGLKVSARDGKVLLEWRRLKDAVAYNVYRGPAGATRDQLLPVNTDRVAGISFADNSPGLANGTPLTYAVAAVFAGADGSPVEGPLVAVPAAPAAVPGEWAGISLNASPVSGAAAYDAATDTFTLRGSGWGDSDLADAGYFLNQRIEGDTQITARLLTRPTGSASRQAGLMLREGLDAGARQMRIGFAPVSNAYAADGKGGLHVDQRTGTDVVRRFKRLLSSSSVTLPIVLRLTRQGETITAEYSLDDGKTFEAGGSYTFAPPLEKSLFVGLYVNAGSEEGSRRNTSEAKFSGAVIRKP
jgi:hypothetical protein